MPSSRRKNGFIKGEEMRLLRTNSLKTKFEESLGKFKQRLRARGYPSTIIERCLLEVNFASRPSALTQNQKTNERTLPFVTTYHAAVKNLKNILMESINQSIIYFKMLRQRAIKLDQNTNVYK